MTTHGSPVCNTLPVERASTVVVAALAVVMLALGGLVAVDPSLGHTARVHAASAPAGPAVATTTVTAPSVLAPLTGLAVADPSVETRPALSIKVDDVAAALPEAGLDHADLITETLVEGGLTRLLATYQSTGAPLVGPVRSARPVDAPLLAELGGGLFAYSGAAAGEIAPVRQSSGAVLLQWLGPGTPGFQLLAGRAAPHQVFASTAALYLAGAKRGAPALAPRPLFTYSTALPAGAQTALHATMAFSAQTSAAWDWDPLGHDWQRSQDGFPDVLADGSQITASDVVILSTATGHTGIFDAAGNEDPLPEVIGSGPCWVMRDGRVVTCTWQRPSIGQSVQLLGPTGTPVALAPGRTWMELLPRPNQPRFS